MKYRYFSVFLLLLILSVGAVTAQDTTVSDSNIGIVQDDDVLSASEFIIDDSNYNTYFDESGVILENSNISDGDSLKLGNINDKNFVIDKNLTITSNASSDILKNVSFNIIGGSEGSVISNLNIQSASTAITIYNASNIQILENNINIADAENNEDLYAIYADLADKLNVNANVITYVGKTNGTAVNNAIYVSNSDEVSFELNEFTITVPSVDVDWKEIPPASGNYVSFPVSEGIVFKNVTELLFSENTVNLTGSNIITLYGYDTIYVVDVSGESNVIINNTINANGRDYVYGLIISGNDLTVADNKFDISADNYADGIDVEGPAAGIVSDNEIKVTSPVVAYAIYAAMSNGNVSVNYYNNNLTGESYAVFGMELSGISSIVENNNIILSGNYTTGIASRLNDVSINENNISIGGSNVGNMYVWDGFGVDNVAIKVIAGNCSIANNDIVALGKGIIVNNTVLSISENNILVEDTGLADSYGIYIENSIVTMSSNTLNYTGKTNSSFINNAVYVVDSVSEGIKNNTFEITIPSIDVRWEEIPSASGNYVSFPVSEGIVFKNVTDLLFSENTVNLTGSDIVTAYGYDTIYVVDVNSDNAVISSNIINANGRDYVYGLIISGNNLTVADNKFDIAADNYADAIDVEGPAAGIVSDNVIEVTSPVVAYGIYAAMSNGNVSVNYVNNSISGDSYALFGFEVGGNKAYINENIIYLTGNYTTGIAIRVNDEANITYNEIVLNASNEGNMYVWDGFGVETTGIHILGGNTTVTNNNITTTGEYAVDAKGTGQITDNYLIANEYTGDASVDFIANNTVANNTPTMYRSILSGNDLVIYYKNGTRYIVRLTDAWGNVLANQTVVITINNVSYTKVTNANGATSIPLGLNSGNYTVTATYTGTGAYTNASIENNITILSTVFGEDLVKVYRNASQYIATFYDKQGNLLANTTVQFNINGVMYERKTNANGTARLNIWLEQGEYVITAINPVNGEMHANNITVLASITNTSDLQLYYCNGSQYMVTIIGADGKPVGAGVNVSFNINGVFYTRKTNSEGIARLNIKLQPGNYTITAEYNGCRVSNNIEVLPILYAEDLVKKYGTSDQFRALLLNGQGKPYSGQKVTFNINGLYYERTTNEDGYASLNIKVGAAVDEYIITSSYGGTSISNKIIVYE